MEKNFKVVKNERMQQIYNERSEEEDEKKNLFQGPKQKVFFFPVKCLPLFFFWKFCLFSLLINYFLIIVKPIAKKIFQTRHKDIPFSFFSLTPPVVHIQPNEMCQSNRNMWKLIHKKMLDIVSSAYHRIYVILKCQNKTLFFVVFILTLSRNISCKNNFFPLFWLIVGN